MKNSIQLFVMASLLLSCGQSDNSTTAKPDQQEGMHDMSIYHLPSDWNTHHGEKISFQDLKGQPLVVVMIYTACKTACPRLVADMREIEAKAASQVQLQPRYILVSIDPENDHPEKLKQFASDNGMDGEQWLFLQGTESGVREFANVLSMKYKKIDPIDFSHSNIISVFDREGVLQYQKEGLGLQNEEIIENIQRVSEKN
ncbi:SCO family protein [Cyclobacterium roseum]|uniref:SCO family protein n=1 Tax=Cyclobacterium roseum TaxID=2666137 RepID=UPI0013919795|nr:SCO family protein [Cyclobacterium roseum]